MTIPYAPGVSNTQHFSCPAPCAQNPSVCEATLLELDQNISVLL